MEGGRRTAVTEPDDLLRRDGAQRLHAARGRPRRIPDLEDCPSKGVKEVADEAFRR